MPTVKSIATVAALDPGEIVSACRGKVKQVFTYHTGKISKGKREGEDYSLQNIILQDLDNPSVEVECKLDGREEMPTSYRGKVLNLISASGARGLTGLKIEENTYKGKTKKVLKVTASAEVTPGIDGNQAGNDPEPGVSDNEKRTQSPQEPSTPTKTPPPHSTATPAGKGQAQAQRPASALTPQEKAELDAQDVKEAKKLACRLANTYLVAYGAARRARVRLVAAKKEDLTEEAFQAFVSTITIQMFRENAHLRMPYRDFDLNGGTK